MENESLLKILEQLSEWMKRNPGQMTKSKSNQEIKNFYSNREKLMKTYIFDRTIGDIYRPNKNMIDLQEKYINELKKKLEEKNQNI